MEELNIQELQNEVAEASAFIQPLKQELSRVIVGQEKLIERLIIGLITKGHLLVEGVPGLAKTLTISSLADAVSATCARLQFTPDLLPADIIGTSIYNPKEHVFSVKKGPVFANLVLADEINRAPAKVQSALLEAMQERQVTIGGETHPLPDPFLVMATQNPIDQEGTYPLPEAQMDRFMMNVIITYPKRSEEALVLEKMAHPDNNLKINQVTTTEQLAKARTVLDKIYLDPKIAEY
ncbi:MAG: AAA family ATPase, partial [Lentisphaeraceae bacterium]|nr:AAA family ATPase [Lentisphaeraceae bacterium]